jgi:hypothetical protein
MSILRSCRNAALCALAVQGILVGRTTAQAAGIPTAESLEEIVVEAQRIGLVGSSRSATEGVVPGVQLEGRPVLRAGEVLEVVPGLDRHAAQR